MTSEVFLEFGGVGPGGGHYDDFEVFSLLRDALEQGDKDITCDAAFVNFVQDDGRVSFKKGVVHGFSQKHFICHILEECGAGFGLVVKSNRVAHMSSQLQIHFAGNPAGD